MRRLWRSEAARLSSFGIEDLRYAYSFEKRYVFKVNFIKLLCRRYGGGMEIDMRKTVALFLVLLLLASTVLFTVSSGDEPRGDDPVGDGGGEGDGGSTDKKDEPNEEEGGIRVPEYKDYGRGTIDFTDMVYERPSLDEAVARFDAVTALIEANEVKYEEQLARLEELDALYVTVTTMGTLANIYNSKDAAEEFWAEEFEYISTGYPRFSQAIEKLFVAAAQSPNEARFEKDYFGEGALLEYEDGGIYTDALVELMAREAELEAEYSAISTANTVITYGGVTDTYDNVLAYYLEKYGEGSRQYLSAKAQCDILYEAATYEKSVELFVELIRERRLIADELGYESYELFAYETLYHDYDPKSARTLVSEVAEYVVPVYLRLYNYVFYPYISDYEATKKPTSVATSELINGTHELLSEMDGELGEIFSYMLQHGLYDVAPYSQNRFQGSFTTYIDKYEAPYLFVSTEGKATDYITLAHEFGHFTDAFINYDASTSLDLSEVSSQALELLLLTRLDTTLSDDEYKYLVYSELDDIFGVMIYQSFYASFEMAAYDLEYDEITEERLNALVAELAKDFGFSESCNSVYYVLIPHLVLYPFYVQSYVSSVVAATEIGCLEYENAGAGLSVYKALITRGDDDESFEEALAEAGVASPFAEGTVKELADTIYYKLLGSHYFNSYGLGAA